MVHIVQLVLHGNVETPQVYSDEVAARAAYVEFVKRYWANSYGAFCQGRGVDSESFPSAREFISSLDLADRSRVHYWALPAEDAGEPLSSELSTGLDSLKDCGERLGRLLADLDQASTAVRAEVSSLLATVAGLSGEVPPATADQAQGADAPRRLEAAAEPEQPPAATPAYPSAEMFGSREWQEYVATIRNMCGGGRSEYHLFTRSDWRQAVYSNETAFEYWDWVAAMIDLHIERAQQAGYIVVADGEKPGCYRFKSPEGVLGDSCCEAEGEAWCRAGLHLAGK